MEPNSHEEITEVEYRSEEIKMECYENAILNEVEIDETDEENKGDKTMGNDVIDKITANRHGNNNKNTFGRKRVSLDAENLAELEDLD